MSLINRHDFDRDNDLGAMFFPFYSSAKKRLQREDSLVADELDREIPGDAAANGDLEVVIIVEVAVAHAEDGGSPAKDKGAEFQEVKKTLFLKPSSVK